MSIKDDLYMRVARLEGEQQRTIKEACDAIVALHGHMEREHRAALIRALVAQQWRLAIVLECAKIAARGTGDGAYMSAVRTIVESIVDYEPCAAGVVDEMMEGT